METVYSTWQKKKGSRFKDIVRVLELILDDSSILFLPGGPQEGPSKVGPKSLLLLSWKGGPRRYERGRRKCLKEVRKTNQKQQRLIQKALAYEHVLKNPSFSKFQLHRSACSIRVMDENTLDKWAHFSISSSFRLHENKFYVLYSMLCVSPIFFSFDKKQFHWSWN